VRRHPVGCAGEGVAVTLRQGAKVAETRAMRCIHHSREPLRLEDLRDGNQVYVTDGGAKPDGLWFSVGDGADWRALVKERYNADQVRFQTEVIFAERPNIWHISDAEAIDALTAEYGRMRDDGKQSIDWAGIANKFSGIIIAPHCEERSTFEQTRWYSCWEVSCGCVWVAKVVKCLRPVTS
jgi:hypothetical protein